MSASSLISPPGEGATLKRAWPQWNRPLYERPILFEKSGSVATPDIAGQKFLKERVVATDSKKQRDRIGRVRSLCFSDECFVTLRRSMRRSPRKYMMTRGNGTALAPSGSENERLHPLFRYPACGKQSSVPHGPHAASRRSDLKTAFFRSK